MIDEYFSTLNHFIHIYHLPLFPFSYYHIYNSFSFFCQDSLVKMCHHCKRKQTNYYVSKLSPLPYKYQQFILDFYLKLNNYSRTKQILCLMLVSFHRGKFWVTNNTRTHSGTKKQFIFQCSHGPPNQISYLERSKFYPGPY